jgi:hypothetical protein
MGGSPLGASLVLLAASWALRRAPAADIGRVAA